jgi:hypothetical protein
LSFVSTLGRCAALTLLALVVAVGAPSCDAGVPTQMPQAPQMEAPQMPEIPQFQPPQVEAPQAPDAPQVPLPPGQGGGNCCIRKAPLLESKCGGAASCCTKDFDSMGRCEEQEGMWFFTPEGCAGAC